MNTSATFGPVLTAMATPFDEDGDLDLDGAATLARWLVDHGNDGLVVAGTTGESPVLTDGEKADLWRCVAEAVTVPVIAGSGSNDTAHSVHMTKVAEQTGAAGILAVTPYYNRPGQSGLEAHFRAVAEATTLPVLIRSEEHTSELQSPCNLVCRLLLEQKKHRRSSAAIAA